MMKGEEEKHREAYDHYLAHIEAGYTKTASVKETARRIGVSEATVWNWKRRFHWDEKQAIDSYEIKQTFKERNHEIIIDFKTKYLAFLNDLIDQAIEEFREGRGVVMIRDVGDLERVIKVALLLQGEATSRTESSVLQVNREKIEDYEEYFRELEEELGLEDGADEDQGAEGIY